MCQIESCFLDQSSDTDVARDEEEQGLRAAEYETLAQLCLQQQQ